MILAGGVVLILLSPGLLLLCSDLALRLTKGDAPEPAEIEATGESDEAPRFLVLVPAHDEERLIGGCVAALQSMEYPASAYRTVVIADNCSDRTAEIVEGLGVECLQRRVPEKRGKPHALAWALEQLELTAWDYLVIIDADARVEPEFAEAVATRIKADAGDHFQAYNGIANADDTWLTRLSDLLVDVRYEVMFPRKESAGVNCPLTGNGMCLALDTFRDRGWQFFSLTENWEAYAYLTTNGERIAYVPGARVLSEEASSASQSSTRRQRWLAGRYAVLLRSAVPLIRSDRIGWTQKIDAVSELLYPGPVLNADAAVLAVVVAVLGLPAAWAVGVGALAVVTMLPIAVPAIVISRRSGSLKTLLRSVSYLPFYAVWRAGIALLTAVRAFGEVTWEKTERDGASRGSEHQPPA